MNSELCLSKMPERVLNTIIGLGDFRTLFNLRKVCRELRNFIDDSNPEIECISISLTFLPNKINFVSNFEGKEDEEITYRVQEKFDGNLDFVGKFFKDFQLVLAHLKAPLPRFSLKFQYSNDKTENFIYNIQKLMKKVLESSKLQVEKFIMNAYEESQILTVLPYLDSKCLKEIWVLDSEFWLGVDKIMEIKELVKLDQWKSANTIVIRRCIPIEAIAYFRHTTVAFVSFFKLNIEDLEFLRQAFLKSTTLEKLRFEYANFDERQLFFDSLGPPIKTNFEDYWQLKDPSSDESFQITHNPQYRNIVFSRIKPSEILNKYAGC